MSAKFQWSCFGPTAYVAGTWNNWTPVELLPSPNGGYELDLNLAPGTYHYKFVVNGVWFCDSRLPTAEDNDGNINNVVEVHEVPYTGKPGTVFERTFIAVKPDGVQRGLVGEIIQRFEKKGYKLVAVKEIKPTQKFAQTHYQDLKAKSFFPHLVRFFSSGPVVAMVWEGKGVVAGGRTLLGATNPAESLPGTIRGDLCVDIGRNICHGSDSPSSAQDEIALWFKPDEVINWTNASNSWVYE